MQNKSNQELMSLVMLKHRPALEEIYDRYVKLVYSFAMKSIQNEQIARDIVQLVFIRLWTTKSRYNSKKGNFISWLLTITRNITIDCLRKERKQKTFEVSLDTSYETENQMFIDPGNYILQKETMLQACQFLNKSQQKIIELLYWQGYTLGEIAVMLNEPIGTVKSRLHQALRILRKHLASSGRDDGHEQK